MNPRVIAAAAGLVILALLPAAGSAGLLDHLTTLFVYVSLAITWNALAGYAGLVSVGQQLFFGLGAYGAIRLAGWGVPVFAALPLGAVFAGLVALLAAPVMLQLRGGEFAIGMWVLAEIGQLLVTFDPMIQGATGTSLLALDRFAPAARRADTYELALAGMAALGFGLFALLRTRSGAALQAIRDDEIAAASVGVRVAPTRRLIFVFAAFGAGLAGAAWLASAISFQPATFFGVQWSAYMIFMTLVGGIGTFEGPILGALLFFAMESAFGATGVFYLIGLGAASLGFALFAPAGLWGRRWLAFRQLGRFSHAD